MNEAATEFPSLQILKLLQIHENTLPVSEGMPQLPWLKKVKFNSIATFPYHIALDRKGSHEENKLIN